MPPIQLTKSQHWELVLVPQMSSDEIAQYLYVLSRQQDNDDFGAAMDKASDIQRLNLELRIRNLGIRNYTTDILNYMSQTATDEATRSAIEYELQARWILSTK